MIKVSKKDIYWGYFAQIFSVASGLVTLPLILKLLSAEEIGMNYLMLTLGALVALFDFGFTPQFSRNITYVFSGAQVLRKEGLSVSESGIINYRLLATMIHTAKFVYRRLALIVFLVLLSLGTIYIYYVTNGFTNIDNSLSIWLLFSVGTFFNIFYAYYASLLIGKGLIMQSKKALVYSRLVYIILTFVFLYSGLGLMGVVLANLIAPFVNRYISYHYFFTNELNEKINGFDISKKEKVELFEIVWYNAKKLGLVFVGSYAINKLSIFLAGLFLSLAEIASYGLMIQLFGLLSMVSGMFFGVFQPRFASLRSKGDNKTLVREFAFSMNIYYLTFIVGSIFLLYFGPYLLSLISSNVILPSTTIVFLFAIILFLEGNHSNFATLIVTNNNVPFVKSALIAGFFIGLGDYISLRYTGYGILGLVLVQGLVQIAYANWKWPLVVFNDFQINFKAFLLLGMNESFNRLKLQLYGR
ncbi:MAG TPA: polysaccharide biosynthesis protein [Lutibacter sp.]|nr:polysaccharide biosynthesis protein [Lutibacter sp.]